MGRYIHLYETDSAYNTARSESYVEPWVSETLISGGSRIDYNKTEDEKLFDTPLTFEILSDGDIKWVGPSPSGDMALSARTIQYKKNDGDWTTIISDIASSATAISVSTGDTIQFKGTNTSYCPGGAINQFVVSANFDVKGNIMSLINADNFSTLVAFSADNAFRSLFVNCTTLRSAKNLILPATALTYACYSNMFDGCTSLTTAPDLPATTLANTCYYGMFKGCTSLTKAPKMSATSLAASCCKEMFKGCSSLIEAPELSATNYTGYAANACYQSMFENCTSLTTAPDLPSTTVHNSCYASMFKGCTSLTKAPSVLPATLGTDSGTIAGSEYQYMFQNCTSLVKAPDILSPYIGGYGCYLMFSGCTSLNYIRCLTTSFGSNACQSWMWHVAENGTFVKANGSTWGSGSDGIPTGWTVIEE